METMMVCLSISVPTASRFGTAIVSTNKNPNFSSIIYSL